MGIERTGRLGEESGGKKEGELRKVTKGKKDTKKKIHPCAQSSIQYYINVSNVTNIITFKSK